MKPWRERLGRPIPGTNIIMGPWYIPPCEACGACTPVGRVEAGDNGSPYYLCDPCTDPRGVKIARARRRAR